MPAAELATEYKLACQYYDEGDTTKFEYATFTLLNPQPEGLYLNFGAGIWSNTLYLMGSMGHKILGYEPFAPTESKRLITTREQFSAYRFDGIMSHNVLDRLQDPVGELNFLAGLLKPGGIMAHSVDTLEPRADRTKFHLFFFARDSLNLLIHRAGFEIINSINNEEINYYSRAFRRPAPAPQMPQTP